ncbi:MAG: orotidine-5'-phosphate decarboxylase [Acidobacteriota bacterium]
MLLDSPTSSFTPTASFADRLVLRQRRLGHPLCIGLDPHLDRIPPLFRRGAMTHDQPSTVDAVVDFLEAILDRVAGRVAIVKPQIALFEQLGWRGLEALERIVARARAADLMVLLDAKRGDIGSTAEGYARAYFGADAGLRADALTVSPYLGLDTLQPFFDRAGETDAGVFVLVRTSNRGAGALQELAVRDPAAGPKAKGQPLYLHLAAQLADAVAARRGDTGWSSIGVVVGAGETDAARRVRAALPHALFLVPGYGHQGGRAAAAVRGFEPGPAGMLEGGLVNAARSVLFPSGGDTDDAPRWERAIDDALERAIDALGSAVGTVR